MWDFWKSPRSKVHWLTSDKWGIDAGSFSPDGKSLTWTANVDGNTNIYLYDIAAGHASALPLKSGVNTLAGDPSPYSRDGIAAALLPQRRRRAQ